MKKYFPFIFLFLISFSSMRIKASEQIIDLDFVGKSLMAANRKHHLSWTNEEISSVLTGIKQNISLIQETTKGNFTAFWAKMQGKNYRFLFSPQHPRAFILGEMEKNQSIGFSAPFYFSENSSNTKVAMVIKNNEDNHYSIIKFYNGIKILMNLNSSKSLEQIAPKFYCCGGICYPHERTPSTLFTITELGEMDFDDYLQEHKFEEIETQEIFFRLARKMLILHSEQKIIHRDFKDQNVILLKKNKKDSDKTYYDPLIIDYEFSQSIDSTDQKNYRIVGTNLYVDPEHIQERLVKVQNDIWGFGMILLRSFMGELYDPPLACKKAASQNNDEEEDDDDKYSKSELHHRIKNYNKKKYKSYCDEIRINKNGQSKFKASSNWRELPWAKLICSMLNYIPEERPDWKNIVEAMKILVNPQNEPTKTSSN